ncbi:hypothetical protein AAE02nite_25980 [Adhaeribacter aerolatus]|uniref:Peptidase S1 domain-containing protein n=1 Tax=Adhaeribacter aerolatus TaxID=670289 RepID=A0A512AZ07_9BACT|nr:trypsin-like serine protease [Adhaeribacter aerolatus]GEO04934.1 hypothetical protein AAE02nite_25980 [Adhaeribacter aerolatus]
MNQGTAIAPGNNILLKTFLVISLLLSFTSCSGQEKVSTKNFDEITLVNHIQFHNNKYDQQKFSCGFLLEANNDTFAVTAKHLLKVIKPQEMKALLFEGMVKQWSMYPLNKKEEMVVMDKLLNQSKAELLDSKATYENDWLVFSVKKNYSKVKPLQLRTSALQPGEKLYVVGWTRTMEDGPQRVYEFEYYKTIANRILLKDVIAPEKFGGLSGAPLVDAQGLVVGIVSNGTTDPDSNKKYFSPCALVSLASFLNNSKQK